MNKLTETLKEWWHYSSLKTKIAFLITSMAVFQLAQYYMVLGIKYYVLLGLLTLLAYVKINQYFYSIDVCKSKKIE